MAKTHTGLGIGGLEWRDSQLSLSIGLLSLTNKRHSSLYQTHPVYKYIKGPQYYRTLALSSETWLLVPGLPMPVCGPR